MDIILYNIILGICSLFIGYFLGSIPSGVIICQLFYGEDPRNYNSKNSGGTNVGRTFGKKAGLLTIIFDIIKTVIPMIIVFCIITYTPLNTVLGENWIYNGGALYYYLASYGACLGHIFPIYAGFRGGKVVASTAGFILFTSWLVAIISIFSYFLMLKWKKYVSLAGIVTSSIASLLSWVLVIVQYTCFSNTDLFMWGWGSWISFGWEYALVLTLMTVTLILRHIPNIKRLINGNERKISWMK